MACANFVESPRISFSRDFIEPDLVEGRKKIDSKEFINGDDDFEFCMGLNDNDPTMLPADKLIFQGKILPFQLPQPDRASNQVLNFCNKDSIKSNAIDENPSPKAPKCSWKELLGLKKLQTQKNPSSKTTPKLQKKLVFSAEPLSINQPLLPPRDSDADSTSARVSVSSSTCDLEELPRYSVDSINEDAVLHKPLRTVNTKAQVGNTSRTRGSNGVSSGKVGLERSCSSPSSFGKRDYKYRVERSYSANVRVAPVLHVNVPVCIRSGKGSKGGGGGMFGLTNIFSSPRNKDSIKSPKNPAQCNNRKSSER